MNHEMYEIMKDGRGFIAALDQSGGSSSKTLKAYGLPERLPQPKITQRSRN